MRWVLYLSLFITISTATTCLISIVLPYWLYARYPQLSYQGLWQRCYPHVNIGDSSTCEVITLPPEFLDAVRCLMIVGFLLYIIAAICAFVFTFVKKEKISLINAALLLMLIGGLTCLSGVIVYGTLHERLLKARGLNLHAGFALAVCNAILAFLNTFLYCVAKVRGEVE